MFSLAAGVHQAAPEGDTKMFHPDLVVIAIIAILIGLLTPA